MLIISKQNDYYDTALSYGVDKSVIYKRKECFVKILDGQRYSNIFKLKSNIGSSLLNPFPSSLFNLIMSTDITNLDMDYSYKDEIFLSLSGRYILFCGEIVPFIFLTGRTKNHRDFSESFYDKKHLFDFLYSVKYSNKKHLDKFLSSSPYFFNKVIRSKKIELFLNGFLKVSCECVHHEIDSPIIELNSSGYVKNPLLKKYKFAKKYDPFSAYQKIEQFVSGVLGGQTPRLIEISDDIRLESHGFDKKTSFRKEKTKK